MQRNEDCQDALVRYGIAESRVGSYLEGAGDSLDHFLVCRHGNDHKSWCIKNALANLSEVPYEVRQAKELVPDIARFCGCDNHVTN